MTALDEVSWVEMMATAHVHDWQLNERRMANLQDDETRALVTAGLLVIVDDATRALLPPPPELGPQGKGCGCGR